MLFLKVVRCSRFLERFCEYGTFKKRCKHYEAYTLWFNFLLKSYPSSKKVYKWERFIYLFLSTFLVSYFIKYYNNFLYMTFCIWIVLFWSSYNGEGSARKYSENHSIRPQNWRLQKQKWLIILFCMNPYHLSISHSIHSNLS